MGRGSAAIPVPAPCTAAPRHLSPNCWIAHGAWLPSLMSWSTRYYGKKSRGSRAVAQLRRWSLFEVTVVALRLAQLAGKVAKGTAPE